VNGLIHTVQSIGKQEHLIQMKLNKVTSGGQTGADRTALECAKALGLETGGTAPKGYRTEAGADFSLKDFGLIESKAYDYASRTKDNVRNADVTLWFGHTNTPGYKCTKSAAASYNKPFIENPTTIEIIALADLYWTWNVAGNRFSKNPRVVLLVQDAFEIIRGLNVSKL
jgi:hypothetical protein